ncbi:type II toxin-antitoxin system Phd/YefM family antitoxin [Thioalkalivibrio thiocyanoxidans]|uniref:type II toxin-antitoxin system Phd/YefM family antitoxin n=1 Tax=Thioalkalivibrio thiocyanoxidans TaxID=152475 RepID=UPI00037C44C6|nr:type II toxin-antitoxin system prevent-host-death family antitoxin [Thioalkalivibrio thiocyanoxidans]
MEATTKDMRLHSRELLAAVDRGEEIEITYRGRLRARLVPYRAPDKTAKAKPARNPLFGLWRDQTDSVDEHVRRIRQLREFD